MSLATKLQSFALIAALTASSLVSQTTAPPKADFILIEKSARTMKLVHGATIIKIYKVALSTKPIGAKQREGDHRVPEGRYTVDAKNAHSQFHLALHISYPNPADLERARKLGVKPGGNIEIHGLGKGYGWIGGMHTQMDWTDAVSNSEIEEIWPLVAVGTHVEIRP